MSELGWMACLLLLFLVVLCFHAAPDNAITHHVKFYFRLSILLACCLVASIGLLFVPLFKIGDASNLIVFAHILTSLCSTFLGIRYDIKNIEVLRRFKDRPCVVVANHQSILDILVGCYVLTQHIGVATIVSMKEILWVPVAGLSFYLGGVIFIDRSNPVQSRECLRARAKEINEKKWKLLIFPEGVHNPDSNTLLPFKKGAFRIAIDSHIPILPTVAARYSHIFDLKKKVFNPGTITVHVLPPVSTDGLTKCDVHTLAENVRNAMLRCYLNDLGLIKAGGLPDSGESAMPLAAEREVSEEVDDESAGKDVTKDSMDEKDATPDEGFVQFSQ